MQAAPPRPALPHPSPPRPAPAVLTRSLTSRAGSYAKRVRWIDANRDAIVGALKELLLLAPADVGA